MAQNVTTEQLQEALEQLSQQLGINVHDYVQSQGFADQVEVAKQFTEVNEKINAITELDDNGVESLAEKIKELQGLLNGEGETVQNILDKLAANEKSISDVKNELEKSVSSLNDSVASLATRVSNIETSITDLNSKINSKVKEVSDELSELQTTQDEVKSKVDTLTAGSDVEGSIDYKMVQEKIRTNAAIDDAKSKAIESAKAYADEKLENLDLASNEQITSLDDKIETVKSVLNDTTDENGELQKGIVSRLSETEKAVKQNVEAIAKGDAAMLSQAKAYTDSMTLDASKLDISKICNIFASALNSDKTTQTQTDGEAL